MTFLQVHWISSEAAHFLAIQTTTDVWYFQSFASARLKALDVMAVIKQLPEDHLHRKHLDMPYFDIRYLQCHLTWKPAAY